MVDILYGIWIALSILSYIAIGFIIGALLESERDWAPLPVIVASVLWPFSPLFLYAEVMSRVIAFRIRSGSSFRSKKYPGGYFYQLRYMTRSNILECVVYRQSWLIIDKVESNKTKPGVNPEGSVGTLRAWAETNIANRLDSTKEILSKAEIAKAAVKNEANIMLEQMKRLP